MKKKLVVSLLIICLFIVCGCSKKEEIKKDDSPKITIKNYELEELKFKLASDFVFNESISKKEDDEDAKKVFVNGDLEKDSGNVIFVEIYRKKFDKGLSEYVNNLNIQIKNEDEKYVLKENSKIKELYAREKINMGLDNFTSYVMEKDGYVYKVNIQVPQSRLEKLDNLINTVYSSLEFR